MELTSDSELESSELGTKQYWDKAYANEFNNFQDHGDVGEVWFGEESILRIIKWLQTSYKGSKSDPIIDIGCGNGMMLIELAREGFTNLTGIDYSEHAIALANSVASKLDYKDFISFKVCNLLTENSLGGQFSLALDKGTYDAICLNPVNTKENRVNYVHKLYNLLKSSSLLIITSCNWTDNEIISHFGEYFKLLDVIPTPEFKFGGKSGKLISCLVLQRIN